MAVCTIETMIVFLLTKHHLHLGHLVIEIVVVVVEMLLVKVEYDADMGTDVDVIQLMAGEFSDNEGVAVYVGQDVEQWDAHIAGKKYMAAMGKGVVEYMPNQCCGGALAFSARYGNCLGTE